MGRAEVGEGGRLESRGTGRPCVYEGDDERLVQGRRASKKTKVRGRRLTSNRRRQEPARGRGEVRTAEMTSEVRVLQAEMSWRKRRRDEVEDEEDVRRGEGRGRDVTEDRRTDSVEDARGRERDLWGQKAVSEQRVEGSKG